MVDISKQIDKKIDANRANVAKGPGGHLGLAPAGGTGEAQPAPAAAGRRRRTADRNYIKEFVWRADRELGKQYGVEYAEAFHYIGGRGGCGSGPAHRRVCQRARGAGESSAASARARRGGGG